MKILASKGNIFLVEYDSGLFGIEHISQATSYGLKYGYDKYEIIKYYNTVVGIVDSTKTAELA